MTPAPDADDLRLVVDRHAAAVYRVARSIVHDRRWRRVPASTEKTGADTRRSTAAPRCTTTVVVDSLTTTTPSHGHGNVRT